jgi:FKBP-type peptidyl-prolyl cis-trans isomerase (trigger factor)
MVHRFEHDLRDRGIELSLYLARLGKTHEQLKADWRAEAERQVRIMLVLRQFAKDRAIAVDAGELETAMAETVAQIMKSGQATEEQIDAERVRTALAERILRDKVLTELERTCA